MPHRAFLLALLDLKIGDRRQKLGIPIDQTLVAVDQPVTMHLHKDLDHRARQAIIKGESVPFPVGRRAEAAHLALDRTTGFGFPFPHPLNEGVAAHFTAIDILFGKLAFDNHLRGDAGMVLTRLPERITTPHTVVSDQQILQREGQRVPHMKAAGDIRRRHHDGIGCRRRGWITGKGTAGLPALVPALFYGLGIVGLGEFVI